MEPAKLGVIEVATAEGRLSLSLDLLRALAVEAVELLDLIGEDEHLALSVDLGDAAADQELTALLSALVAERTATEDAEERAVLVEDLELTLDTRRRDARHLNREGLTGWSDDF
jgi:hypothetical protein